MLMYAVLLSIFFLAALVFYTGSCGWLTGKPLPGGKFAAAIFLAMLFASLLGTLVLIKLECQRPDRWLDLSCVYSSLRESVLQLATRLQEMTKKFP